MNYNWEQPLTTTNSDWGVTEELENEWTRTGQWGQVLQVLPDQVNPRLSNQEHHLFRAPRSIVEVMERNLDSSLYSGLPWVASVKGNKRKRTYNRFYKWWFSYHKK